MNDKSDDLPIRDQIAIECLALDRMWAPATMEEVEGLFGGGALKPWSQADLAAARAYHMADAMLQARKDRREPAWMTNA